MWVEQALRLRGATFPTKGKAFGTFIVSAAAGDVVSARIIKVTKNYAVGKIKNINKLSENKKLVGKVNYASSMQSHKIGACKLYDDAFKSIPELKDKVRANQIINFLNTEI